MQDVQDRSERSWRARYFMCTAFPSGSEESDGLLERLRALGETLVHSREGSICAGQVERCPETERLHIHFYYYSGSQGSVRSSRVFRALEASDAFLHPNVQRAARPAQALRYCIKEDTRVAGPVYFPDEDAVRAHLDQLGPQGNRQGRRSDLDDAKQLLDDFAAEGCSNAVGLAASGQLRFSTWCRNHRALQHYLDYQLRQVKRPKRIERKVFVRYGASRTGKSYSLPEGDDVYYKSANDQFFGDYNGERVIVFDDFRGGWFKLSTLLQILDSTPSRLKCYGKQVANEAEEIYITSNVAPHLWYPNADVESAEALFLRFHEVKHYTGRYVEDAPGHGVNIRLITKDSMIDFMKELYGVQ